MQDSSRRRNNALLRWCKEAIQTLPSVNTRTRTLVWTPQAKTDWPSILKCAPNPTIAWNRPQSLGTLQPEPFYKSTVVFWAPHIFFNLAVQVLCPLCGREATTKGWQQHLRRVLGLSATYYVYGYRYQCCGCPSKFVSEAAAGMRACVVFRFCSTIPLHAAVPHGSGHMTTV
jgi:hypothetical protein